MPLGFNSLNSVLPKKESQIPPSIKEKVQPFYKKKNSIYRLWAGRNVRQETVQAALDLLREIGCYKPTPEILSLFHGAYESGEDPISAVLSLPNMFAPLFNVSDTRLLLPFMKQRGCPLEVQEKIIQYSCDGARAINEGNFRETIVVGDELLKLPIKDSKLRNVISSFAYCIQAEGHRYLNQNPIDDLC